MPLFLVHLCVLFSTLTSFDCQFLVCNTRAAAKRLKSEPLGFDQWYLDEIKEDYQNLRYKGYDRVDIGAYNLKVLGSYPEADFEY